MLSGQLVGSVAAGVMVKTARGWVVDDCTNNKNRVCVGVCECV